jgi:hypothetical protein
MRRYAESLLLVLVASIPLALTPSPAGAYLGPGGGLSLLTTALAMLAVFSASAIIVLTWPVRALKSWLQRRRDKAKADGRNGEEGHAEDKR